MSPEDHYYSGYGILLLCELRQILKDSVQKKWSLLISGGVRSTLNNIHTK